MSPTTSIGGSEVAALGFDIAVGGAPSGGLVEALAISREVDDPAGIVSALANLAKHAVRTGALGEAWMLTEEAIALARSLGFDSALPTLLHHLGAAAG